MHLSTLIARNIAGLRTQQFSAAARAKAELAILDTVGVMLAGSDHAGVSALKRVVLGNGSDGQSTVVGDPRRAGLLDAAQINGMAAHMLDFDDSNSQLFGHPSVAVLPALLALAEREGASGRQVVEAYLGGFEAAARIGTGISRYQYTLGWHPTSSVGIFGAVAACALLLDLDEARIAQALGIAASMSAGVKSNFGSMTKPLHVGQAARNGLQAVLLAAEGFTAASDAFEHPQGYLRVYNGGSENYDIDRLLAGWNDPPCVLDLGIKQKRFPVCYACLAPIDGILALRDAHGLRAEDIESIRVEVHPIRFPHINVPDPASPLEAKFSVHFCVAQAFLRGTLRISDFEDDSYRDPLVRSLMARISFGSYGEQDNLGGAEVSVRTRDGSLYQTHVVKALGAGYDHPLTPAMVRAKFEECASRILPAAQVHELYELLGTLSSLPDIRRLTAGLAENSLSHGENR
ncbi:MmgE/PrpD family protein [Pseudothauera rhizosphaerae]|uniref:MmgE/PrpD family protein n=1 Tax=Pseudothauera rhizosphaerae TaxID=2565932 RepID=A0A4V3W9Z5_9RHOO|nr:MmgE/PrpD family protein [Pseudothauera rhizosphaerae]THF57209.1 MmgE/PrpD family protein [Pseudothauera rhizosphaerae]